MRSRRFPATRHSVATVSGSVFGPTLPGAALAMARPVLEVVDRPSAGERVFDCDPVGWQLRLLVALEGQHYAIGTLTMAGQMRALVYFCDDEGRVTEWVELLSRRGNDAEELMRTLRSNLNAS